MRRVCLLPAFPPSFAWGIADSAGFADAPGDDLTGKLEPAVLRDVKFISSLNVNAYRFSIAWEAVQPNGSGTWNEAAFDVYFRLLDKLAAKKVAVHINLSFGDLPLALRERGGWANRATASRFSEYAAELAQRLGQAVAAISTFTLPDCKTERVSQLDRIAAARISPEMSSLATHHRLLAHGLALQGMRASDSNAKLGISIHFRSATGGGEPNQASHSTDEKSLQGLLDPLFRANNPEFALTNENRLFAPEYENDFKLISQALDFLGLHYATPIRPVAISSSGKRKKSELNGAHARQDLTWLLLGMHRQYRLPPLIITEGGIPSADSVVDGRVNDELRARLIRAHLEEIYDAMEQGVDVCGYFYSSLIDKYEWNQADANRAGLVYVNFATQRRSIKESGYWYRNFIASQSQR